MNAPAFDADLKLHPYWWETTPRPVLPSDSLPARVDVLVIGSGYTGLGAALVTSGPGGRRW